MDLVGYTVAGSVGSRTGKNYNDASGNPLPNEGGVCAQLIGRDEGGEKDALRSVFQVVKVHRPLWSIGRMLDNIEDESDDIKNACIMERTRAAKLVPKKASATRSDGSSDSEKLDGHMTRTYRRD